MLTSFAEEIVPVFGIDSLLAFVLTSFAEEIVPCLELIVY